MQSTDKPSKFSIPFANSGTKNTIPTASQIGVTAGAASLTDGFPPITFTPVAAGGVPPSGADFNGILNQATAAARWAQAGGGYPWDSAFSTAIGGYPKGAYVLRSDGNGYWLNTVENNTTNPDSGGAGWSPDSSAGLFSKNDSSIVAFQKTGAGTASTQTGLTLSINGGLKFIPSGTSITMPSLVSGTDYAIWAKTDSTLEASASFVSPPSTGARKIGGFHYAPGGNASAQAGGNTTPQINEYSFYDVKFRPACPDPRGMALIAGGYWMDIYLTGVDAITNGSSKYNVTMADGSSPPKVPTLFGGNGSTTYGTYTWFEAMELATAFGKRCPTQQEFMSAAYGTTEASSVGTDQINTVLNSAYTSKWGLIQATGVLWIWSRERAGPFAGASWNANTEGRGSEYNAPNAALLGGGWGDAAVSGSRSSGWDYAASVSGSHIGSRFAADHLQAE